MPMPEAAVDEDHEPVFRKNEIGPPREIFPVKAEAQSHTVGYASDSDFRSGVPIPDLRHVGASAHGVEPVGHRQSAREGSGAISFPACT